MVRRLDRGLLRFARTRGHSRVAEAAMSMLGAAGEWGAVWAVIGLAGAAADPARRGRWLRAAAIAPCAVGANYAVKIWVRRPRPRLRGLPPLAGAPSELSSPSAHATSSLAAATAFGRVEPRTRLPLYGLAMSICATRPYLGMHYPSDVLAGAALVLAIGALAPGVGERSLDERLVDLIASVDPETSRAGVLDRL
jgi:decaprenylphosphoryl-5-phosphoribose phosphatase